MLSLTSNNMHLPILLRLLLDFVGVEVYSTFRGGDEVWKHGEMCFVPDPNHSGMKTHHRAGTRAIWSSDVSCYCPRSRMRHLREEKN